MILDHRNVGKEIRPVGEPLTEGGGTSRVADTTAHLSSEVKLSSLPRRIGHGGECR